MAQQWQIRRGTNSENNDFTGAVGEVTMDIDRKELRLHDGSTQGGTIIGRNYKSNCITEISQDIKLELNAGTLTLKAGSKIYVPNGVGVFDIRNITADQTYTQATNGQYLLFARQDMSIWGDLTSNATSGTTPPAGTGTFYNTTTNSIDWYSSGTYNERHYSFPFALITVSNGVITSIDQVFNGFGYIGSTVFVLPGVKGLIPDGRNDDGALKNTSILQTSVAILDVQDVSRADVVIFIKSDHTLQAWGRDGGNVASLVTKPAVAPVTYCRAYIEDENLWYHSYATTTWEARDGTDEIVEICAVTTDVNRRITNFRPKTTFHAIDYNEADFVVDFQRPTVQNNYTWYRKYKSGWVEQGCLNCSLPAQGVNASSTATFTLPITMNSNIYHTTWARVVDGGNSYELTQTFIERSTTNVKVFFFSTVATAGASTVDISVSGMAA